MSTGRRQRPRPAREPRRGSDQIRRDVAPIWARPAPGQRRPKLTREQIAELALAIADAEGFEAVSMRRLATELDVGTMTLYYYVQTKDDLLALMDDALMGEIVIPDAELPPGWRAGLTAIARRSRDVFTRHPWALRELEGARIGPNGLRHIEQSLAIVDDLDAEPADKLAAIAIVDDFVFGFVLRQRDTQTGAAPSLQTLRAGMEFAKAQLATGDFPHLAALIGDEEPLAAFARFAAQLGADGRFERGLSAILDGIAGLSPQAPARTTRGGAPRRRGR